MSGAPSYEIKGEPQSGVGCVADSFMNMRAELLPSTIGDFCHEMIYKLCEGAGNSGIKEKI